MDYTVIQFNSKALCLLCNDTTIVLKEYKYALLPDQVLITFLTHRKTMARKIRKFKTKYLTEAEFCKFKN